MRFNITLLVLLAALAAIAIVGAQNAVASVYDVELAFKDETNVRAAHGSETITFNYTIKHTGDYLSEEVIIEVENEPLYWQHYLAASTKLGVLASTNTLELLLQRNETAPMSLSVTLPQDAPCGTYWMTVNVYPKKDTALNRSHDICIVVPQAAASEMSLWNGPPEGHFAAVPPSNVTLTFALYNTGNGMDRFLVRYESSLGGTGWVLTPVSGLDEDGLTPSIGADPGKQHPHLIELDVSIPADAKANVSCEVVVNATSVSDPSVRADPVFATVEALQYYDFEVSILGEGARTALPGSQVEFQLSVLNRGNGWDEFTVSTLWDEQLNPGFTASTVPRVLDLASDGTGLVSYVVTVPENASKRACFFTARVSSSSTELAPCDKQLQVDVSQLFGLSLSSPSPRMSSLPGGILDYEIYVQNDGNGLDSMVVNITGVPPGWLSYISPPEVALLAGEQCKVTVRILIPDGPEDAPIGSYVMTVRAASSRSDAEATFALQLDVLQLFRLSLSSPSPQLSSLPGGILDYEVLVQNDGNGADSLVVTITGVPPGWLSYVTPPEVSLQVGEQCKVTVRILIPGRPENAPIGSYNMTVKADSSRSDAEATIALQLDIVQFFRIEWMYQDLPITDDTAPTAQPGILKPRRSLNPYESDNIEIPLEVRNFGNGDDNVEVWGTAADSGVSVTAEPPFALLARGQTKLIKVRITVATELPPGVYSVLVKASSQNRTTLTKVVPIDFEVYNFDARVPPVPTYVDPEAGDTVVSGISVEPGTNLSFKLRVWNAGTRPMGPVLVRAYDSYVQDDRTISWNFLNVTTPPIAVGDAFVIGVGPFYPDRPPLCWWADVVGPHTIRFQVCFDFQSMTDNDASSVNVTVRARNLAPTAAISPVTGTVSAGSTSVTLNASGSMDSDGTVSQYLFDFGDGTNSTWITSPATTHTYSSPGTYTVTVMVRDDKGMVSETSASITVTVQARPTHKSPGFGTAAGAAAIALLSLVMLDRRRR